MTFHDAGARKSKAVSTDLSPLGLLQKGELTYRVDGRSLYSTVIKDWWDLPVTIFDRWNYSALGLLAEPFCFPPGPSSTS
jgi:hypothetical protein